VSTSTQIPGSAESAAPAPGAITTGGLAAHLGAELIGRADLPIRGLAIIDDAGPQDLTFIRSAEFARRWAGSRAGGAIVTRGLAVPDHDAASRALLVVPIADVALIRALELFAPPATAPTPGIHPSAAIDPTAEIGPGASIGPHCSIGPGSRIGQGTVLAAGVRIGRAVRIGAHCTLHPAVVIQDRCIVGDHCVFHPGVVIGADGFGYIPSPDGRGVLKVPHIGIVEIGRHVEIGANACIDRAKFGATTVGDGTKIDNLVQVGHNCRIGRACLICGGGGIAGSVTIGDGVIIGGQVGIADNSTIGAGARIGAMSGVNGVIPPGESWVGAPARPASEQLRSWAALGRLGRPETRPAGSPEDAG
jgi:UDP-3-O-[3-hydroxymyristoyl] glucosamine N-acyltransferase